MTNAELASLYWNTSWESICDIKSKLGAWLEDGIIVSEKVATKYFPNDEHIYVDIDIPKRNKIYIDKTGTPVRNTDISVEEIKEAVKNKELTPVFMCSEQSKTIKVTCISKDKAFTIIEKAKVDIDMAIRKYAWLYEIFAERRPDLKVFDSYEDENIEMMMIMMRTFAFMAGKLDLLGVGIDSETMGDIIAAIHANYIMSILK